MAENKNNRKSNRNFRLDKHVERHFEIEKGTDDASVMPDNTLSEPPSTPPEVGPAPISPEPPTGDDEESESGGSSIKWVIIVLIIVAAIAIFAYIFMSGGKDKENADKEIPQTEQNDSNQNSKNVSDSVTNSLPTPEEATPTSGAESTTTFRDGKNVSSLSDNETKTPSKKAATSSVCKINIDSDSRLAMTAAIRKTFAEKPAEFDPRKYLGPARDNMEKLYKHKIINVLGSNDKL